jgi:hypothetical protein
MVSSDVVVTPVEGKSDLKAFIALPKRLFAGHKGYVPHLDVERQEAFSPKKNPLFKHVEVQFFLARRAGKVVGRITGQIDRAYLARYAEIPAISAACRPRMTRQSSPPCSRPPRTGSDPKA